jgi:hypothetical protein
MAPSPPLWGGEGADGRCVNAAVLAGEGLSYYRVPHLLVSTAHLSQIAFTAVCAASTAPSCQPVHHVI